MTTQNPKRSFGVAAVVVIAALGVSVGLFASSAVIGRGTGVVPPTIGDSQKSSSGSMLLSKTWGPWVFNASINSTSVNVGGALLVSGNLTYRGSTNNNSLSGRADHRHQCLQLIRRLDVGIHACFSDCSERERFSRGGTNERGGLYPHQHRLTNPDGKEPLLLLPIQTSTSAGDLLDTRRASFLFVPF